jgi:hypothetical protein
MDNPKELFWYEDGKLYRKHSTGGMRAGSLAGRQGTRGYWQVKINGRMYSVHHLVWWIFHGYKPEYIDHIDGDPTNNRIGNLREATHTQNMWNAKLSVRNTTGHKGVFWNKQRQKYTAKLNGQVLGHCDDLLEAAALVVYTRAFGHGEFARDA